jgi:hypothetical protein
MDPVSPNIIINSPQEPDRVTRLSQIQKLKNKKEKKNPISESGKNIIRQSKSLLLIYSYRLLSKDFLFKLEILMISHPEINNPKACTHEKKALLVVLQPGSASERMPCLFPSATVMDDTMAFLRITCFLGRHSCVCQETINFRGNILLWPNHSLINRLAWNRTSCLSRPNCDCGRGDTDPRRVILGSPTGNEWWPV